MTDAKSRWLALYVLCLGDLMIVLDSSIVNVALPSIQSDLGFSQSALAWVVNAYLLTFGGFLLLSGRLGDLLGNRRVFLGGVDRVVIASFSSVRTVLRRFHERRGTKTTDLAHSWESSPGRDGG